MTPAASCASVPGGVPAETKLTPAPDRPAFFSAAMNEDVGRRTGRRDADVASAEILERLHGTAPPENIVLLDPIAADDTDVGVFARRDHRAAGSTDVTVDLAGDQRLQKQRIALQRQHLEIEPVGYAEMLQGAHVEHARIAVRVDGRIRPFDERLGPRRRLPVCKGEDRRDETACDGCHRFVPAKWLHHRVSKFSATPRGAGVWGLYLACCDAMGRANDGDINGIWPFLEWISPPRHCGAKL